MEDITSEDITHIMFNLTTNHYKNPAMAAKAWTIVDDWLTFCKLNINAHLSQADLEQNKTV